MLKAKAEVQDNVKSLVLLSSHPSLYILHAELKHITFFLFKSRLIIELEHSRFSVFEAMAHDHEDKMINFRIYERLEFPFDRTEISFRINIEDFEIVIIVIHKFLQLLYRLFHAVRILRKDH
jgi:hypothetical protein